MTLASRLTFPPPSSSASHHEGAILQTQERDMGRSRRRDNSRANAMGKVCKFWLQGRCTKPACIFVHPPIITCKDQQQAPRQPQQHPNNKPQATPYFSGAVPPLKNKTWHRQINAPYALASTPPRQNKSPYSAPHVVATPSPSSTHELDSALPPIAHNRISDGCDTEEQQGATLIANISGHQAAVTHMVLPGISSQMLFSAGKDAMLHAWDCSSGLCSDTLHLAHPPSCMFHSFSDPHWLFIGLPDEVRVCNISTHSQQTLTVNSPVLSLTSSGNLLAAGLQDGSILVWRFEPSSASFHPFRCLAVPSTESNPMTSSSVSSLEPCLAQGSSIIYAGSLDGMIRMWDLASGTCLQALCAHKEAIVQLLSCDTKLLVSASKDGTIKLWKVSSTMPGYQLISLQDTFVPKASAGEDGGALYSFARPLAMCGVFDEANKPILFAAYSDNKVHIMEVPSFRCKGTIRTESPIQAMDTGLCNILFLGSSTGNISAWKWK